MSVAADRFTKRASSRGPALLVCVHTIACCVSLAYVARYYAYFDIHFDKANWIDAALGVLIVALISPAFAFARFSFGYVLGFYFYTMVIGYIWLSFFTPLHYDVTSGQISATLSIVAFLLPVLFITRPLKPIYRIPEAKLNRFVWFIVLFSTAIAVIGASYDFQFVGISDIYRFRGEVEFPTILNYLIGTASSALLPYAFAYFSIQRRIAPSAFVLILIFAFFPITLNKLQLFEPAWLLFVLVLLKIFEARTVTVLSLLLPLVVGLLLVIPLDYAAIPYFGNVNFRMIAIPSAALDHYNHFFSTHPLTYFCQISQLKPFMDCPYNQQLSLVMQGAYQQGNYNGSLFTVEGTASVGIAWAPVAIFGCGLVLSFANQMAAGLSPTFILISSAILPQIFLNVAMTTTLVSNGAAVLFVLWYLTPRTTLLRDAPTAQTFNRIQSD